MYRDALEAAHTRISELEARLAGLPKKRRSRNLLFIIAGCLTYVHADWELFVIDASTGAVLGTI